MRSPIRGACVFVAIGAIVFGGCRDQGPPELLTGFWRGAIEGRKITLAFEEADGEVGGSGHITRPDGSLSVTQGTRTDDSLSISLLESVNGVWNFIDITAEYRGNTIVGVVNGSHYQDVPIRLNRF